MITVYYKKVFPFSGEDTFFLPIEKIDEERRVRLLSMKSSTARLRSLAAGLILYYALCERLGLSSRSAPPFRLGYGERGKPYLRDYPEVFFNLSHSGDYVCCALGDGPVGVDIQKKISGKEKIAERFFTPGERQMLDACSGQEKETLFFRMWSVKESYLKLTGTGLSGGLADFEICWPERSVARRAAKEASAWFEESEDVEGYSLCVCFRDPAQNIFWKNF